MPMVRIKIFMQDKRRNMQLNSQQFIEQDKMQRQLALDANQSFIVQAPAGSGKTELLIQRFLTLLIRVKTPEEILAITFTKKSANEMRLRVIKALKQAKYEPEPDSAHAKQTWQLAQQVLQRDEQFQWHLINNPNQLRIQTIDSLCAYLTRQLPLLSNFGSEPALADNPLILYREAVMEVLSHVEEEFAWSPAIALLLLHLDNDLNKLHDLLVSLLAKRDQWLPYIKSDMQDNEVKALLEHHLQLVITDHLTYLNDIFPREAGQELLVITPYAINNLLLAGKSSPILACRDLTSLPGTHYDDKQAWVGLATLLLTKSHDWRKRIDNEIGFPPQDFFKHPEEKLNSSQYKQRLLNLIIKLNDQDNLRIALQDLFYLPDPTYNDSQWQILRALLQLLKIVAAQLRLTFQQHGQIDFIENAQAALYALGTEDHPTDLALMLDYQLKHILVDEFQDTSFSQYQLLKKLTAGWQPGDGRSLFVVGDPMQSIYRFREAEVGLFIRMRKQGIGEIKLTPLTLGVNFRSAPTIVDWNNLHFAKIFPSFNDIANGAVTYSPSGYYTKEGQNNAAAVTVHGYANQLPQTHAAQIIDTIKSTYAEHPNESIAILVRSRSHLQEIIPVLKQAQIPYQAIDIDPLESRQSIQDLLSLTCALLHPADRISWLSILRAPWCGLKLADLLIIAGNNPYDTIWEKLIDTHCTNRLSDDGKKQLARVMAVLQKKMASRQRESLRSWVESTWLLLGGPACLTDISHLEDANAFFNLLTEFEAHYPNLDLDKLKEKINKLYAGSNQQSAIVQIMTMHTAKGLEFDTVILPHLERKMPPDDKALLQWMERPLNNNETALLLAPIHATGDEGDKIYEYINRQHKLKLFYEIDRLFYVATTRAKKRLHLFFNAKTSDGSDIRVDKGSFLQKIWPFIDQSKIICEVTENAAETTPTLAIRKISRLQANWVNPLTDTHIDASNPHQQQSGFQLKEHQMQIIGTVTHKILQNLAMRGITWWQKMNAAQQKMLIENLLVQMGMPSQQLGFAYHRIQNAINNMLMDERGTWILQPRSNAYAEHALTAVINGECEKLVLDRVFYDENNVCWIIDYKTTTFTKEDLQDFLAKEQGKYREKMHVYAQALKMENPKQAIKLGLYFPSLPAWIEWD